MHAILEGAYFAIIAAIDYAGRFKFLGNNFMMLIDRYHFPTISSTNSYAKEQMGLLHRERLTVISADRQLLGRGRLERSWHSPSSGNIYASFCLFLPPDSRVGNLAQVLALSAVEMAAQHHSFFRLKWPNDLFLNGKKIGGILAEVVDLESVWGVILGIGINIHMDRQELSFISQAATSLFEETGRRFDLEALLVQLIAIFQRNLKLFQSAGLAPFLETFQSLQLTLPGEKVTLRDGSRHFQGLVSKIGPDGSLELIQDGYPLSFHSGEISSLEPSS
ncbi:MAG: birA [Chlamydiales bacterium]|jgi:BirA family biotin operon repressor/biotin-[acetyl-CoA-carboxylase] ligase|nr:birA [Chlamydiales bacterium]